MTDFRLLDRALVDYREIGRYTQRAWGRDKRRQYLKGLDRAFTHIAANPHLGVARDDIGPGVRAYLCQQHVVFYRQGQLGMEILRVLHMARDVHHVIGP